MFRNQLEMDLILFVIFTLIFTWLLHLWHVRAQLRLAYQLPSERLHTLLGFGKILGSKTVIRYVQKFIGKYGPNCVMWMGPYPIFCSTDPQLVSEILTSKNCLEKPTLIYNGISRIGGQGLITRNASTWIPRRRLISKVFSSKTVHSYMPIFDQEINVAIQQIDKSVDTDGSVDLLQIFRELTVKNAAQTTLRRKLSKYDTTKYAGAIHDVLDYIAEVSFNHFLRIDWLRKFCQTFIYRKADLALNWATELVNESVDLIKTNNNANDPSFVPDIRCVLDYALKGVEENVMLMEEIRGEMLQIFAAAFETTSSALYFTLLMLAMHPEYQELVYKEVINVLPKDDGTTMTLDQLNQLKYVEMVFNETLRVVPVVPSVLRKVSTQPLELSNGLELPVGQIILIEIRSMNRCKKIWGPNAEVFNPDNFLPQNVAARHPFQFIPFTKDHRVCIGMKYATIVSKMTLAKIIKKFAFSTDFKFEDLVPEHHMTLKLAEAPLLAVRRRQT